MTNRFDLPAVGPALPVRFPRRRTAMLPNGLAVQVIRWPAVPVASIALVIPRGSASDPADRPGLMGLTTDMLDEGAGSRDTIALAEAFARLGTHLDIDVAPDATTIGLTAVSRHLEALLDLVRDVIAEPTLDGAGLDRIRELRLSRLQQLRRTPAAPADRTLLAAIFGTHPYGHGVLGTSASLQAITVDDVQRAWRDHIRPEGATLLLVGDVEPEQALAAAQHSFERWRPDESPAAGEPIPRVSESSRRVRFVDRPGAPQSEVRVGQTGPARSTTDYHALVTLNALLGGQFTSRINRNLRETRGITYGARTWFDFRRAGGSFECDASVQADATAVAVREILREIAEARADGALVPEEVAQAKASLTRGYARGFETARQLIRAAAHLVTHQLPDDTFDRFVPTVEALTGADLIGAAERVLQPSQCSIVVVGDPAHRQSLEEFGAVEVIEPEF